MVYPTKQALEAAIKASIEAVEVCGRILVAITFLLTKITRASWSNYREKMQGMNISVFNVLFDDRYGGPQKRVIQVAEMLFEHGVQTILGLPSGAGNAAEIAKGAGVSVRRIAFERIPSPRNLGRLLRWIAFLPRDIRCFVTLFRREQPDVIHVNGAFFIAPAIAAKLTKVSLVWHLNDTLPPARIAAISGLLVRLLANRIVVAAKAVAVHYGVDCSPHEVIYAPVHTQSYGVIRHSPLEHEQKVPRIGLIANWNPVKGLEYFVRAATRVREHLGGKLDVVFAGARLASCADYSQCIDALIDELGLRDAIRDYGFVPSVIPILTDLDVLVLSSTTEACPMAILEGMAAGVPVVATDVGGVRELLLGDPTSPAGIVVSPRQPKAIATAILDLLASPDKASRMGENGRRLAKERFSLEVCTQRHLKVYADATNKV